MQRTITAPPPVEPKRLYGGHPVLEPDPAHSWESRVVLNPAAVLVTGDLPDKWMLSSAQADALSEGACAMMYRAQGDHGHAASSLGLALFTPQLKLVKRWSDPVIRPEASFHHLGVEDARCTRIDDVFYLYYTGYALHHGEPDVRICLATSSNLVDWTLHGPAAGDINEVSNKNAALLPRMVDGRWILLHRPMEGPGAMTVHWAVSDSPEGPWRTQGVLMESYIYREFTRSWIGAGGPPVSIGGERFLMIYHQGHFTAEGRREYDLAAALLDFGASEPVVARIEPLMRPATDAERLGDPDLGVDNVLFTCANYVVGDDLIIPYAGADSRIFGASIGISEMVAALGP